MAERLMSIQDTPRASNVHPAALRGWARAASVTATDPTAGEHTRQDTQQLHRQIPEYQDRER
jgi:hypothetical protein